ncbi:hypothetical protein [Desertivirga xinjiangensis]|uniref:hypothetical protein n=1 Tax=Desertivirga xinjiangensis TaxID=539206 RepID=UPI00210E021F|nr:hypothetical protein [Pedobacter xinjiangensis]
MEKILSETEAAGILGNLTENDQAEIKRDKVRFGEYYIGSNNNRYYRVNPINVINIDGRFTSVVPHSASAGI